MTKLTLQEQMLKAGLVSSKKMAKVQRNGEKIARSGYVKPEKRLKRIKKRRSSVISNSANNRSRPRCLKSIKRRSSN